MTDNEAQLNHEVASVRSVTKTETGEPEEVADDTVPGGAIAGGVVAGVVVITALVAAVAFAAVYLFSKRKPPSRDSSEKGGEMNDYSELPSKEELA
jgi:hypothetical protein